MSKQDGNKGNPIGIDFGTMNIRVGVWGVDGRAEIIPNDHGSYSTKTFVSFDAEHRLVGQEAKVQALVNPKGTIFNTNHLIGRNYDDPQLQGFLQRLPYKVHDKRGKPVVKVRYQRGHETFTPEEIGSMLFYRVKIMAEDYLGREVRDAVLTVPAYFDNCQKLSMVSSARMAGLNPIDLITEPVAVALAHMNGCKSVPNKGVTKFIFDLGGTTFDVSVISVSGRSICVRSINGDAHLGGVDFDKRLMDFFSKEFYLKSKKDITKDKVALTKLKDACDAVKHSLSSSYTINVSIGNLVDNIDFKSSITRVKFEELCIDLFARIINPMERALKEAGVKSDAVDEVILVGGSAQIPIVQKFIANFFNKKISEIYTGEENSVVYGAAIHAASIAAVISNDVRRFSVQKVAPQSLCVGTAEGESVTIIPKCSVLPIRRSHVMYRNVSKRSAKFDILQGESNAAAGNKLLGTITLDGLVEYKLKRQKFIMTYDLGQCGTLEVAVYETVTGNSKGITIWNRQGNYSPDEVHKMRSRMKAINIKEEVAAAVSEFDSLKNSKRLITRFKKFLT